MIFVSMFVCFEQVMNWTSLNAHVILYVNLLNVVLGLSSTSLVAVALKL